MNLKQTIRKVLREDTDRSLINKILRRVDLDDALEEVLNWSLGFYKPRLKDMTENDFVDVVIYNLYIDHISQIFEDWSDEDYEMPTITISEKEENKIQSFLIKLYSDRIKHAFQKETKNIKESILKEEDEHSENVLSKMITKHILKKGEYPWAVKVYSVELKERDDNTWDARILIEIDPTYFKEINKHWGNYSDREKTFIYYGMEISKHLLDKTQGLYPYYLETEIRELAERIGFDPHYSLFNTYFVIPPNKEEWEKLPDHLKI